MFEDRHLDTILNSIDPLLTDPDRFKQRAGAEVLVGLLRGMYDPPNMSPGPTLRVIT